MSYPFKDFEHLISYVSEDNSYMRLAKQCALKSSLDAHMKVGCVIVKANRFVSEAANGSIFHTINGCVRKELGLQTGEGYDLCEGCHPRNHAEQKAISLALSKGMNLEGAELFLWGHYGICESCWGVMLKNGIRKAYLVRDCFDKFPRGCVKYNRC